MQDPRHRVVLLLLREAVGCRRSLLAQQDLALEWERMWMDRMWTGGTPRKRKRHERSGTNSWTSSGAVKSGTNLWTGCSWTDAVDAVERTRNTFATGALPVQIVRRAFPGRSRGQHGIEKLGACHNSGLICLTQKNARKIRCVAQQRPA